MSLRLVLFTAPLLLVLLQLRPGLRALLGAVAIVAGALGLGWADEGWPDDAMGRLVFAGGLALLSGGYGLAERFTMARRLQALRKKWPQLVAAYRDARSRGQSDARFLTGQGIRGFELRRFVRRRLQGKPASTRSVHEPARSGSTDIAVPRSQRRRLFWLRHILNKHDIWAPRRKRR